MGRPIEEEEAILGFPEEERELVLLLIQAARNEIHRDYEEKGHRLYRPFLLHIENNLTSSKLNVSAARKAAKLTNSGTYSPEFKRMVGMSPKDYIEHHRMKLAKRLLQHTRAEVYLIAYAVGYKDPNLFSRNYKNKSGYKPTMESKADRRVTESLLYQLKRSTLPPSPDPKKSINVASTTGRCDQNGAVDVESVNAFWEDIR